MAQQALAKPLLIFGLRGTLLERIHNSKLPANPTAAPQLSVGLHKVWLRPHVFETLAALSDHCDIAVWSSTTAKNTTPLMEAVFANLPRPFKFVWTREHTASDDFRRLMASQHEDEFATLKDLSLVRKAFPEVPIERMVLIDDTPSKSRLQAGNLLWLQSFNEANLATDASLLALQSFIKSEILPAADVRKVLPRRL